MSPATSESKPTLSVIPNTSLKEFWLPLSSFDVSARSKTGCGAVQNGSVLMDFNINISIQEGALLYVSDTLPKR